MSEIVVTAIITPKPGADADKIEQLLASHAAYVQANEPGTLRYRLHKSLGKEAPVFTMIETYKDKASIDAHGKDPKFQEMAAQFGDSVDMKLYVSQPVAGFEDRAAPSVKM
ncbi:Antibiotic biosynthesis monooxygenase [Neofusicoccum parvum]|uniref:ABM domain-containing protein n=2 Tax=Neofusicoccum TaxID=407951 RepID=A0ABR3TED0_9PEZI|nr:Antibiotic biosynthesis monooxygenase [Neofusicoccum parvum]GME58538.1 Antibiotic biosynthesis monooxygenase [Neofusicoccum parvum]